ncbi:mechanosensitive ion channel family protein [Sphingomonas sp.]|uniref:mechanosensitive ion channel family protein n=1 Tax=Sphingomonas sp. TaxID=28214 RepID=UPI0035C85234
MDVIAILFRQTRAMAAQFVQMLPQFAIALVVIIVVAMVAKSARRLAEWLLRRTELRGTLVNLAETLLGVAIWTVGLLIAAAIVFPGVTPGNILAVLGLGSVAIGFAFKDIFENFLAGVLIMLRKQMRLGDMIECQDVEGRVEAISLRDTHLRELGGELVVVPNAYLFKNPVRVLTQGKTRRHTVEVGVAYDVDLDAAREVIAQAVRSAPDVNADKAVEVYAKEFGDSSINFLVRWWAGAQPVDAHKTRDEVVRAIKRALDAEGMEIPFPIRTLVFPAAVPIAARNDQQAR